MSTALIVGGTSGIGLATARHLRDAGATVHVVGRSTERLAGLAATDPGLVGHRADGGDRDQIAAVAEQAGPVDWLVVALSGSEGICPTADPDPPLRRPGVAAQLS